MKAVHIAEFGVRPEVRDVPEPEVAPDGVVVSVEATGLCRSDWHGWMGHDADVRLPHVPGHEYAGVVAEIGADVRTVRVGQRVTVPFVCGCGACAECRSGEYQVCRNQRQPGFTDWGSFAERVAVPFADVNVVTLPDALDFDVAAALGCRFATSYRAVIAHARVREGDWVAVHGCGGVGLSAIMIAKARGARVIAVDVAPDALRLAREFGAEVTVDAGEHAVVGAITDVTGGGAAVSLDALGSTVTAQNSIRCLARRGRHVQIGLLLSDDSHPPLPMGAVIARELEIYGSHGMAGADYPAMLDDVVSGRLDPSRLVTRHIGLDEAPEAVAAMGGERHPGITVITPQV